MSKWFTRQDSFWLSPGVKMLLEGLEVPLVVVLPAMLDAKLRNQPRFKYNNGTGWRMVNRINEGFFFVKYEFAPSTHPERHGVVVHRETEQVASFSRDAGLTLVYDRPRVWLSESDPTTLMVSFTASTSPVEALELVPEDLRQQHVQLSMLAPDVVVMKMVHPLEGAVLYLEDEADTVRSVFGQWLIELSQRLEKNLLEAARVV